MKRGIVVGLLALCILLGAGVVGIYVTGDRKGPMITIPDDNSFTYVEGTDSQTLLEGVEAIDQREGDVSDSLLIEIIQPNRDETQASVTYVARDSKNNMTKKTRIVNYQAEDPESLNSNEDNQDNNGNGDPNQGDPAMTGEDGDTNTGNDSIPVSGTPVDDVPEEDGQAANEAAIAALPEGSPKFYLTQYDLALTIGSSFNSLTYVKEITDDKDTRERLYRNIQVEGEVNSNTAGTYELHYHVVDSDGNSSNVAVLKVTVQ